MDILDEYWLGEKTVAATSVRKGVNRVADVPADIRAALESGTMQSATLSECLGIDLSRLLQAAFPDVGSGSMEAMQSAAGQGIVQRMALAGDLLWSRFGEAGIARCQAHVSDTVRSWGCFMVSANSAWCVDERLKHICPFADDAHFGVREWAWLALRGQLMAELEQSIELLTGWTVSRSENIRRFACEALRPRGVWCAHIAQLKQTPELGLPILQALYADPSAYVQNSVGNWLNDAAKTQPDWVRALCGHWLEQSPVPATQHICRRAMRSLK